jgi:DNA-binding MarR family transcriptional regulator
MKASIAPEHIILLRSLKHTAAVFLVLVYLDRPTSEIEISELLEINPETTRRHLRSLALNHLITRTHRFSGWILTTGGRQLLLPTHPALPANADFPRSNAENPRSLRTLLPPPPTENDFPSIGGGGGGAGTRKIRAQNEKIPPEIKAALEECGFTFNARVQHLAQLEHITPEYIRQQLQGFLDQGKQMPEWCGALLVALETPPPKTRCTCGGRRTCEFCKQKYSEWENLGKT